MRAANYSSMNIYNENQVKEINKVIKSNFVEGKDDFAADSHKTSDVKFVYLGKIQQYIFPFIDFCQTANNNFFGFDLHPLTSMKKLNYNIYEQGSEYSWHIDAVPRDPVRDIKLTALLNLSEENYEGGDLVLFRNVNGLIEIQIGAGGSFALDTETPTWYGLITGNDGEDIDIRIKQL